MRTCGVFAVALLVAAASGAAGGIGCEQESSSRTWAGRFEAWHERNEFRFFGSASSNSLAWWESHLLQAYLPMFEATQNTCWLDRFVGHADTMFALMRDVPDSGDYWPGYADGFLGWGTNQYDPDGRYQEYLVQDAHICIPVARFVRLVGSSPKLRAAYLSRAQRYLATIEQNVVAKWFSNWSARRGQGTELEHFGDWTRLPLNQFLAFGELLLILGEAHLSPVALHSSPVTRRSPLLVHRSSLPEVPADFYSATPDSMARLFRAALKHDRQHDAYTWGVFGPTRPDPRVEDVAHANLDLSFAIEACRQGLAFDSSDFCRFGRTLTQIIWNGSELEPEFSKCVDGSGGPESFLVLKDWARLARFHPMVYWAVKSNYEQEVGPGGPTRELHSSMAHTIASLAALEALVAWDGPPQRPLDVRRGHSSPPSGRKAETESPALTSQLPLSGMAESANPRVRTPLQSTFPPATAQVPSPRSGSSLLTSNPARSPIITRDVSGRAVLPSLRLDSSSLIARPAGLQPGIYFLESAHGQRKLVVLR